VRRNKPSRRHFLSAAAGALALPLLDSLRASGQSDAAPPKRLILLYTPNGTVPEIWFPAPGSDSQNFTLGAIHQPLLDYRERLVLLRGVHSTVAQDPDNHGGPHQRGLGALFTGQMLGTGEFEDGCGATAGWAAGRSIDQEVAAMIGLDTPLKSLELGVRCMANDVQGRMSYAGPGLPLPPINEPLAAYDRLFFRNEPSSSDASLRAQSILDAVGDQFADQRVRLGQEDRVKFDEHLALVEDLERRMGLGASTDCEAPAAPNAELGADDENTMSEVSRLQMDLVAAALSCDLTRVASIQYSTGFNHIRYPWLDSLGDGHALSHSGDSDTAAWAEITARQTWHASELAYLMQKLDAIPEGDGTVLDSTLIVWGNEISKGNSHSLSDIPYLLAGSAGGAIKTGQFLEFTGVSSNQLLLTILRAYGFTGATFGHPDHAGDVIPGLLV
jgi:hypothetical protein